MKLRTFAPSLALGLALGATAHAGVAPLPPQPGQGASGITVESELAANYSSIYEFRGFDLGDHLVDTTLSTEIDFGNNWSLNLGVWYASLAQDDYTELNLFGGVAYDFGPVVLEVGYTWYYFPRDGGDASEPYLSISSADLIPNSEHELTITALGAYDFETDGLYTSLETTYAMPLTDVISLELTGGVAYNYEYYIPNDGFNNLYAGVALPVALTETATLTPYFRASWAVDALKDAGEGDIYLGGVAIAVTF